MSYGLPFTWDRRPNGGVFLSWPESTGGGYRAATEAEVALIGALCEVSKYAEELRHVMLTLRTRFHVHGRRPEECYEMSLIDATLAKNPNEYSAHPASGNAGVKLTPAETVRYDPAPECKGDIAARERLEPKGRQGVDGTSAHVESDAQYGVTAGETATNTKGCHEIFHRWRKKPIVIEAAQFDGSVSCGNLIARWANDARGEGEDDWFSFVTTDGVAAEDALCHTLEGDMAVSRGDFVIRGVKGEFYPCKPDIFAASYEPAEAVHSIGVDHKLVATLRAFADRFDPKDTHGRYTDVGAAAVLRQAASVIEGCHSQGVDSK